MNSDIRLSVGFWQHPKTKKTARRLGLEGVRSLQILWMWAAVNRPSGSLDGMDWEDIELAADWQGEERAFFDVCLGMWIDQTEDSYALHDWRDHNSWAAEADDRSDKARFSRLATVNRAAFDGLKSAGVNAISKDKYDSLTTVKRTSGESLASTQRIVSASPTPSPSPSPSLALETLTSFESSSSPLGEDHDEFEPEGKGQEVKTPACPYQQVVDQYHDALPEHQRVRMVSDARRRSIKARWADVGKRLRGMGQASGVNERLAWLQRFFARAAQSAFLTGQVHQRDRPPFMADFDFLMTPKGFLGVIEGKYDNREAA